MILTYVGMDINEYDTFANRTRIERFRSGVVLLNLSNGENAVFHLKEQYIRIRSTQKHRFEHTMCHFFAVHSDGAVSVGGIRIWRVSSFDRCVFASAFANDVRLNERPRKVCGIWTERDVNDYKATRTRYNLFLIGVYVVFDLVGTV